jgi:uncharacterized protein YbjT (DUF2867 family)
MRIAVVGATGLVGRHVTGILESAGYDVVAISRAKGVDVITGDGLADALEGVSTVVDAAAPSPDQDAAAFFAETARNLQAFGAWAGVQGIVVVSIVGADKFTEGYVGANVLHERLSLAGSVPARVLRAAQFHELVPQMVDWGRNGVASYVPRMRTQLVSARTVAEALAKLATETDWAASAPASIPDLAGPQEESLVEAARLVVAHRGDHLQIKEVPNPDLFGGAPGENGALLPGPSATLAGPTFEEWLKEEYA